MGLVRLAGRVVVALALTFGSLAANARTAPITVSSGGVTFEVDAPDGMEGFARRAAEVVESGWPGVAERAGANTPETFTVSVEVDIADWFERRDVPPRNPEWAAGLAIYSERAIIIRTANPEWESTLRHELAHMAVYLAAAGRRAPRWFHEGFAIAAAEQWSIERSSTMIRAGLSGNFYSFDELTPGFPAASSSADLAYAQSFHFVQFIERAYGDDVFRRVLALVAAGQSWDDAFTASTGRTPYAVEQAWAEHVSTRYKWVPALTGGGGAWGLMAALSLFAWRRNRRRAAARLAALQEQESRIYADDPDDQVFG